MCNPLYDIQAEVSEALLGSLGFAKGGTYLVDHGRQRELVSQVYEHIVNAEPGGSGANTAIGVSLLGGKASYTGRVGNDEHGRLYREGLSLKKVKANLGESEGDTGICIVLVTPDSQRTMVTYLGCGLELSPTDLVEDDLGRSRFVHATAYLWDSPGQRETVERAATIAKARGVRVALSLSESRCVGRHAEDLRRFVATHASVLIANLPEATALTGETEPRSAALALGRDVETVALTLGSEGSLLVAGDVVMEVPAHPVRVVDRTGAGDMYAAALLYGMAKGYDLGRTGRLASVAAGKVVANLGPRLADLDSEIKQARTQLAA
ncbi:MAG: adenosine kinase [Fimbriimonadaceae bacterium]|nr:adenosine kinase [Fimbriimonadaceae bacterium]